MPAYNWQCLICQSTVSAQLLRCANCGCPCNIRGQDIDACKKEYEQGKTITLENLPETAPTHRPDGSNIVDLPTLIQSSYKFILLTFAAIFFIWHKKAYLSLGRKSTHHIELIGTYSSLFTAMSFLALAASALSVVLDHFDRRKNEHKYEYFANAARNIALALIIVSVIFALSIEKIAYIQN